MPDQVIYSGDWFQDLLFVPFLLHYFFHTRKCNAKLQKLHQSLTLSQILKHLSKLGKINFYSCSIFVVFSSTVAPHQEYPQYSLIVPRLQGMAEMES